MLSVVCSLFFYLMAKGTIIFLFLLFIIASLLTGINIGKKIGNPESPIPQPSINIQPSTTNYQPPTITLTPSPITSASATVSAIPTNKITGKSVFTNQVCGITFSYPGSYIKQKSVNVQSTIFTDPDNPDSAIAVACAVSIPRPPVTSDKIEAITIAKTAATLYHDKNPDGNPRDEVIVKNPYNEMEIIIAGYGASFDSVITSLKFVQ